MKSATVAAVAVACSLAGGANAELQGNPISVLVQSPLGQATFNVMLGDGMNNPGAGTFSYSLAGGLDLIDPGSGNLIARLDGLTVGYQQMGFGPSPQTSLAFSLRAGAANTYVQIASATNTFPAFVGEGMASASITLTDTGGGGATMTGGLSQDWWYMGDFGALSLVGWNGMTVGDGQADSQSLAFPAMPAFSIDKVRSIYGFHLSAGDSVNTTSVITAVPGPGVVGLVGVGGFVVVRWRRRGEGLCD